MINRISKIINECSFYAYFIYTNNTIVKRKYLNDEIAYIEY